jgi:hypothetical protein
MTDRPLSAMLPLMKSEARPAAVPRSRLANEARGRPGRASPCTRACAVPRRAASLARTRRRAPSVPVAPASSGHTRSTAATDGRAASWADGRPPRLADRPGGAFQARDRGATSGPHSTGGSRTTADSGGRPTPQLNSFVRSELQVVRSAGFSLARRKPGVQIPSPPPHNSPGHRPGGSLPPGRRRSRFLHRAADGQQLRTKRPTATRLRPGH